MDCHDLKAELEEYGESIQVFVEMHTIDGVMLAPLFEVDSMKFVTDKPVVRLRGVINHVDQ